MMEWVLVCYCAKEEIWYKQGMNEVLAPFVVMALSMSLGTVLGPSTASAKRRRDGSIAVGLFLLVVIAAAWWFYPIWTGEVIPYESWRLRMWMPTWT